MGKQVKKQALFVSFSDASLSSCFLAAQQLASFHKVCGVVVVFGGVCMWCCVVVVVLHMSALGFFIFMDGRDGSVLLLLFWKKQENR